MQSWTEVSIPALDTGLVMPDLFLTNSASGNKQVVTKKQLHRMYVCGITPYDATHLGHAATYLTFDLINRYLRAGGSQVRYVQNITDIDDPLLERAQRDGVNWSELAQQQIDLFRSDMFLLRVLPPESYIGAVEAIPLVTQAIEALTKKASIYGVDQDLYFRVHADSHFGQRSNLSHPEMLQIFSERGGDPDRIGKEDPLDCLVWMVQRPHEPAWDSSYGLGRPGWHIECTAIAIEYLKPAMDESTLIDIQGGGSDLIFPHHEMCAAQAHVISGKPFASAYVHAGMIGLDGEKMSKSKGNLVFVSQLIAAGRDPMAIRWALMRDHYRVNRMWSEELLVQAEKEIAALRSAVLLDEVAITTQVIHNIVDALADDLDTYRATEEINAWVIRSHAGDNGGDADSMRNVLDALLGIKL
jgi:L-cysteine:1D-myo-inositol 2-amino-2-deoxy-alpha-D-glucopyranoside ligase